MRVQFAPEARQEFADAQAYYERQSPRLGMRFRTEVRAALARLSAQAQAYPVEGGPIRRLTLRRFPYALLYSIEPDHVYLLAVAHYRRAPKYWVDRL